MKKIFLSIFLLCFFCFVISKDTFKKRIIKVGKNKLEFHEVRDSLYAQITEVSNEDYRFFLNSLKSSGKTELYQKYYPDSTKWQTTFPGADNKGIAKYYFWHPFLRHYPVVNVTQEAANAFCIWLLEQYNLQRKDKTEKVKFLLPSREDWTIACSPLPNNTFPWYGTYPYDPEMKMMANVKPVGYYPELRSDYPADGGFYTMKVGAFYPNHFGLYDMIGNVAEMTDVPGVACGGSWNNLIEECGVDKITTYDGADPRLGFRVFMKIEK